MAQPVSSIPGDLVKSSRSIAHSDDFEGHKMAQVNTNKFSAANPIGFEYIWIYYIDVLRRVTKSNPYWYNLKFLAMQMG